MKKVDVSAHGVRFSIDRGGIEVGHAYVYILKNDLHAEPFALLEDVSVHSDYQGRGIGNKLIQAVIEYVSSVGGYKLIATSRDDGTRNIVHQWYERLGFAKYGVEFRMNF